MTMAQQYPWLKKYPASINWHAPIPVAPATQLIDEAVWQHGARPFLEFLGKRWTYAEGYDLINRLAAGLQKYGLKKGERVGLCLPNCPYYVIAYFAILKAGGVVVNLNPLYSERELEHHISDAGLELLFTLDLTLFHRKLSSIIGTCTLKKMVMCKLGEALPFPKNIIYPIIKRKDVARWQNDEHHIGWNDLLAPIGAMPEKIPIDPQKDLAVLQYTGGTTGVPKGAMLSHANVYANAVQSAMWFQGAKPGQEKLLALIPFFHVFAMTVAMNLAVRIGAEIIMLPRFDLSETLETIHNKRPTLFPAVPTLYTAILHHKHIERYDLSSINECISGGAPLPLEVKAQFEKITGCKLVEGYGLSETSPVVSCNPLYDLNKAGSIGLPLPGTEFSLRDLNDPLREVGVGERGEVCLRGPQVMSGYWNHPAETALVMLPDGWLRTGDVGQMDEDGYFFIVDRIKDMILCSGYNVYPRNVEEAIYLHPSVAEVVVIGLPDEYRGQTVKAFIKLKDGCTLTPPELEKFLKDKLSSIERPKLVEFRESLPKTIIGKLSRKALVEEEAAKQKTPLTSESNRH